MSSWNKQLFQTLSGYFSQTLLVLICIYIYVPHLNKFMERTSIYIDIQILKGTPTSLFSNLSTYLFTAGTCLLHWKISFIMAVMFPVLSSVYSWHLVMFLAFIDLANIGYAYIAYSECRQQ